MPLEEIVISINNGIGWGIEEIRKNKII